MRRDAGSRRSGRRTVADGLIPGGRRCDGTGARGRGIGTLLLALLALLIPLTPGVSQGTADREAVSSANGRRAPELGPGARVFEAGRFRAAAFPSDEALARSLLQAAVAHDTFPGLPRPAAPVLIVIAPDDERFRQWVGPLVPEWGAAVAFPARSRIVVRGSSAGAIAGDPLVTLRHELAHLALREYLGFPAPRWFDEGYASFAAGEIRRGSVLAANVALLLHPLPPPDSLNAWFLGGASQAQAAYALAHAAVEEHTRRDPERGLDLFLAYWRETGSYERAIRQAYGVTSQQLFDEWRRRVRLRYGMLALVGDAALLGALLLVLVGPIWLVRRRRDRRKLAALRAADLALEQRERALQLAALLAGTPDPRVAGEGGDLPPADRDAEGRGDGRGSGDGDSPHARSIVGPDVRPCST